MEVLNLVTDYGNLDLSFVPAGTEGYEDLAKRALSVAVKGHTVPIGSLEDIIRSRKRQTGRRTWQRSQSSGSS